MKDADQKRLDDVVQTISRMYDRVQQSRALVEASFAAHRTATPCDKCDGMGNPKTYANQACLPINGKVQCIDWCIHHIVAALNAGGVRTIGSCCGHGETAGRIDLEDGRVLYIAWQEKNDGGQHIHNPPQEVTFTDDRT